MGSNCGYGRPRPVAGWVCWQVEKKQWGVFWGGGGLPRSRGLWGKLRTGGFFVKTKWQHGRLAIANRSGLGKVHVLGD